MEYGQPRPLERLQRILSWTFPLGRFFGSEVRVYGTVGLVWAFSMYQVGKFPDVSFVEGAVLGTIVTVGLYLIVWTHEMGHATAGRLYRIRTPRITLSVFGGLAHLDSPVPGPKADILVALAGPATHLLWLAVVWPLSRLTPDLRSHSGSWVFDPLAFTLHYAKTANVGLLLFNLLPVYPLDGGRAFRGLLATRMHPNRATLLAAKIGMVGAVGFIAWGLAERELGGLILVGIGLMALVTSWSAYQGARYGDGPYGPPRDPWAFDDDAWRFGDSPAGDDGSSRPGFFERRRRARDRARAAGPPPGRRRARDRARAAARRLERGRESAELDRLLERVSESGIAGLSEKERATLQRLSESRRAGR